jgi:hypothetical protein
VNRPLLVADKNVAHMVLLEKRVVDRQYGAAGIAENHIDALVDQRLDEDLRPDHLLRRHHALQPKNRAGLRISAAAGRSGRRPHWTLTSGAKAATLES